MAPLIVSDTSPVNLLIQIGQLHILPALFSQVLLPPDVVGELSHTKAPAAVRLFASQLPAWAVVRSASSPLTLPNLHAGELAAISLARELAAPLLIDERDGRDAATALGIKVVGAIGVLELAADGGIIADLAAVHDEIRKQKFHISDAVMSNSLAAHSARKATIKSVSP